MQEFGEPLEEFLEHNKKQIAECLNSFEYATERTSLTDIGKIAKVYHKAVIELIDTQTEKGGAE